MSAVWIKTPESTTKEVPFLAGEVVSTDGDFVEVKLTQSGEGLKKGEVKKVPSIDTRPRFERGDRATATDSTALVHMNDASILDNLNARHKVDEIYTYTASVLLAVNPYKSIKGLYGDDKCALYKGKHLGALPPHPYAIADSAYRALVRDKVNQAMLISGESGAGKTETAKIVMQYLAFASGSTSDLAAKIQARVLQAQPILESFGNSVTLRNSNSSRFGKYNRVYFDADGTLVDAGIQTYLLESSRVVTHGERERTYHAFYEMFQGLTEDKLKAFHLDKSKEYRLLHNDGASAKGFEDNDKRNFARTCAGLETVGMDKETIDACFKVLAGLVHLGDIPKVDAEVEMAARASKDDDTESDTRCVEVNEESITYAAELLGMDADELCSVLKRKRIAIPGRESMHEVPRSPMQFRQALHSLIKALYKRLFDQVVRRINDSFAELRPAQAADGEDWKNIGILDIYGFERLQRNSFEQLCINLANERLQQYFIENVLGAEQQLYQREGLPWTGLTLPNSEPVVNCISQVFKTLDDFSSRLAKGFGEAQQVSDDRFCEKVLKESSADAERKEILKAPKMSAKDARAAKGPKTNENFIITHYAGTVDYSTKGWLDKNNDRLLAECESLVVESTVPLVSSLGEEDNKQPFRSISSKYSKDLEALLKTLSEANLHYIRCFKPNAQQKPDIFTGQLVLDQIVQCGTIELVKIMHDGFPNRCAFEELYNRFKALLPEKFQRYGMRTFIEALMLAYEVPCKDWALGTSRLFLKAGQLKALEDMRAGGVAPKTENLERIVKQIIRKRWSRAIVAVRLCNWLPKMMRVVYVERAATKLSAVALVTSRLAPRLEAAKKRLHERRLAARRRLVGVFRTVCCMNSAFRQIKAKRKDRAVSALYLGCFILQRTKPAIANARAYLAEAEVRRKREEERRLAELEKKMKEEEERLRLEAEKRREEEEERLKLEAEKRRQEEEERVAAEAEKRRLDEEAAAQKRVEEEAERARLEEERVAGIERERLEREQKADEEKLEQERLMQEKHAKLDAEKEAMRQKMQEEFAQEMAEEKRKNQEQMAEDKRKMEEQMAEAKEEMKAKAAEEMQVQAAEQEKRLAEERLLLDEQRREVEETVRQARLSIPNSLVGSIVTSMDDEGQSTARLAGEDNETDIGESVSVVQAQTQLGLTQQGIQELVKEQAKVEMEKIMKEHQAEQLEVTRKMKELEEKNQELERQAKENASEVAASPLQLSPAAQSTPGRVSPLSNISGIDSPAQTPGSSMSKSRKYSLIDKNELSLHSGGGKINTKRQSVAKEAFLLCGARQSPSPAYLGAPVDASATDNCVKERNWWAVQRKYLMQDLYPEGGAVAPNGPTPSRNNRRKSQEGYPPAVSEEEAPAQPRQLAAALDEEASQENSELRFRGTQKDENIEWVCDASAPAPAATKMRVPTVHSKKESKGSFQWNQ